MELVSFHRTDYLERGLRELCATLVRLLGSPGRLVEVGSHAGESAAIFADYFTSVVCVDSWSDAHLRAVSEEWTPQEVERSFDARMAEHPNLSKLKMPSPAAAKLFPDGFFDGAYIDGSHDYASVRADIEAWRPKVTRFLAGHDWVDGAPEVIRAVMDVLWMPGYLFEDYSWMVMV